MKFVRTILLLLVVAALAAFSASNWQPVELTVWNGLKLDTKLPALVIAAFLLGLVPMWLIHRATRWRLQRRINTLESSLASTASLSSTQLDAASRRAPEAP
jgi:lipopolysaccharide assembly protein A